MVDVQTTRREVTFDNETIRNLPSVRSYSYLLTTVPGVQTNNNNVNTGPVFAIFPIHGGRGVESRLTVDGLNIGNPPGGNQPSNYVADVGNATEVTMTTSGGLGEAETAGLTINIVPKQGGNSLSGLVFVSGFSKGMQASNYDAELAARGVTQPNPVYHVYDVNVRGRRADRQGQALVLHERPPAGAAAEHAEPVPQPERGQPERVDLRRRSRPARRSRIARGRTTPRASPGRRAQRNKFSFVWDEQPICRKCTGATSFSGSPSPTTSPEADGLGEFNPQRVQQARWTSPLTNKLLLEAGVGTSSYQWAGKERDPESHPRPRARVQHRPGVRAGHGDDARDHGQHDLPVAELVREQHQRRELDRVGVVRHRFAQHEVRVPGLLVEGRPRDVHQQPEPAVHVHRRRADLDPAQYINGYKVNARAMDASFYAQDQWTVKRLTLQGAIRYDHPWSWFPAVTSRRAASSPAPASRAPMA